MLTFLPPLVCAYLYVSAPSGSGVCLMLTFPSPVFVPYAYVSALSGVCLVLTFSPPVAVACALSLRFRPKCCVPYAYVSAPSGVCLVLAFWPPVAVACALRLRFRPQCCVPCAYVSAPSVSVSVVCLFLISTAPKQVGTPCGNRCDSTRPTAMRKKRISPSTKHCRKKQKNVAAHRAHHRTQVVHQLRKGRIACFGSELLATATMYVHTLSHVLLDYSISTLKAIWLRSTRYYLKGEHSVQDLRWAPKKRNFPLSLLPDLVRLTMFSGKC